MIPVLLLLLTPQIEVKTFTNGEISTSEFESHLEFSPDGRTCYFVKSTPQFTNWQIYTSSLKSGTWSKPAVPPFAGKYRNADPFITPIGKRFFFISDRPVDGKPKLDMDIWYMDRKGNGWGEPVHLGDGINSKTDEWYPTTAATGKLYFGSARAGGLGGDDIWISEPVGGKYLTATNTGPGINTAQEEVEAFVSPDESTLIFNAARQGGLGGLDLYVCHRQGGKWQAATHLPEPVNSRAFELAPKLSRDGKRFYFTSLRLGSPGLGDIFYVDSKALTR
jgi:Tol biopolymer transport system component